MTTVAKMMMMVNSRRRVLKNEGNFRSNFKIRAESFIVLMHAKAELFFPTTINAKEK